MLVGFFGINEKPTSSKDPFALRRTSIGLLRIITENNLTMKLKDLINYSSVLYNEQNFKFSNTLDLGISLLLISSCSPSSIRRISIDR